MLKQWVGEGGGFCMYSGYLSFAGFQAAAKYYRTPIEEILPVDIYPFDDRVETPEGAEVEVVEPDHLVLDGVGNKRPHLLGYQETKLKASVKLLTRTQHGHPLLAVMDYGKGRTLAWMSDIGPHWCPKLIVEWKGYNRIWQQAAQCLAGRI
ncbi:MAG: glutamine amidotransferase [Spirochaetia bacterium]|nr:glutamine amidotransferase [Spirochaetia bacterium]